MTDNESKPDQLAIPGNGVVPSARLSIDNIRQFSELSKKQPGQSVDKKLEEYRAILLKSSEYAIDETDPQVLVVQKEQHLAQKLDDYKTALHREAALKDYDRDGFNELADRIHTPLDRLAFVAGFGAIETNDTERIKFYEQVRADIIFYYKDIVDNKQFGKLKTEIEWLIDIMENLHSRARSEEDWEAEVFQMLSLHWVFYSKYETIRNSHDPKQALPQAHADEHIMTKVNKASSRKSRITFFQNLVAFFEAMDGIFHSRSTFIQIANFLLENNTQFLRATPAAGINLKNVDNGGLLTIGSEVNAIVDDPFQINVQSFKTRSIHLDIRKLALKTDGYATITPVLYTMFPFNPPVSR